MLDLVIDSVVVGALTIGAGFIGNVMGFTRGRAEKNIVALFTTGQADSLYCLCGHPLAHHVQGGGHCRFYEPLNVRQVQAMSYQDMVEYRRSGCSCAAFVGDPSRNPPPVTPRGELEL